MVCMRRVPASGFPEQPVKNRFLGPTQNDGFSICMWGQGGCSFLKLPRDIRASVQNRRLIALHMLLPLSGCPSSFFFHLFEFQPLLTCLLDNTLFQALLPPGASTCPMLLSSCPLLYSVLAGHSVTANTYSVFPTQSSKHPRK